MNGAMSRGIPPTRARARARARARLFFGHGHGHGCRPAPVLIIEEVAMSRVEPKEKRPDEQRKADRTPDKAEGSERTVDEALRRQDEEDTLRLPRNDN